MNQVVVEGWSGRDSALHARDARVKLGVLLVFLIAVSSTPAGAWTTLGGFAVLLAAAIAASRLPPARLLGRVLLVLPFSAVFALTTWWAGDPGLALALAAKAFLSALAALLLIATTRVPELAAALHAWRAPRILVLVIQFVYRYLFVIAEQARHMRLAALARGGAGRGGMFRAAAGALAVLFVRSWERAEGIHWAMLARGFRGRFELLSPLRCHPADFAFLGVSCAACIAVRLAL
jgi:cobalt/nickel transport system permease protein